MRRDFTYSSSEWSGPAAEAGRRGRFRLFPFLKSLIVPPKGQRILPTLTGYVLIVMAIGLGMAAYNAASNILFIALSVLLSSLIVSGILSSVNFRGICWRILVDPPCRVGDECHVRIEVRNTKRFLPTYALAFIVCAQRSRVKQVLRLGQRLEAQGTLQLDFCFVPEVRGQETIRITGVACQFPFGFLRKTLNGGQPEQMVIWPRRIPYRFQHAGSSMFQLNGRTLAKPGNGSEFINLRNYRHGDSHRQVHWKASARLRNLVVQQYAAESHSGFIFFLQTCEKVWDDREQFERLCSFVSSMAEDLFHEERFHGVQVNDSPPQRIARRADLDFFQDQLSLLERVKRTEGSSVAPTNSVVTFEPSPTVGVHAFIGGQKAATA